MSTESFAQNTTGPAPLAYLLIVLAHETEGFSELSNLGFQQVV